MHRRKVLDDGRAWIWWGLKNMFQFVKFSFKLEIYITNPNTHINAYQTIVGGGGLQIQVTSIEGFQRHGDR